MTETRREFVNRELAEGDTADAAHDKADVGTAEQLAGILATVAALGSQVADHERRMQVLEEPPVDDPPPEPEPLPMSLRRPMFSHMPLVDRLEQATVFDHRLRDGLADGWFMYYPSGNLPWYDHAWRHLTAMWDTGRRFVILVSPKTVTPGALRALYAALPESMRPWVWLAYHQEPEGDYGLAGTPSFTVYQAGVRTCAEVAHEFGALNGTHLQTGWDLINPKAWGGRAYLDDLLGDLDRGDVDFCSESAFNFSASDVLAGLVRGAVPYLEERFPGAPIMFTSVGSTFTGTPTAALLTKTTLAVEHAWQAARDLGADTAFGHYTTVTHGPYYYGPGHAVDTATVPMLHRIRAELRTTA